MASNTNSMNSILDRDEEVVANMESNTIDIDGDEEVQAPATCVNPEIGMEFEQLDDVHKMWISYGTTNGFNVRIEQRRISESDKVTIYRAKYVCSKGGLRKEDNRSKGEVKHRWNTKTNCPVQLVVKLDYKTKKYVVIEFDDKHNHELHTPEGTRMMRQCRHISPAQAATIDIALDSGLSPKDTMEYMSTRAGGREKLGHLYEDQKSYRRQKRGKSMTYEYDSIVQYMDNKKLDNPKFQYHEQRDNCGLVASIFWVDGGMLSDYDAFGDVVIFDTTFGTNKETRSLGIFAGLNNHREITIFGAALLYDETIPTFTWLFETFLKANEGNRPKTFFTDQDAAMAAALKSVLPKPQTYHALCVFHIWNNALGKLGNQVDGESGISLLKSFQRCMHEYDDEVQFEEEWQKLVDRFGDSCWLKSIYSVKEKWANCFTRNRFTLGIHSTQICESVNSDIKAYIVRKLSMTDFFKHFDRVLNRKRNQEALSDFRAKDQVPSLGNDESPILQQVAVRYTPCIFKLFQKEYNLAARAKILTRDLSNEEHVYVLSFMDSVGSSFQVLHNSSDNTISCSCKLFDYYGILCCHCLKVDIVSDVMEIPEWYILKRWTREAKTREAQSNIDESHDTWMKRMQDSFLSTIQLASMDSTTRVLVEKMMISCDDEVHSYVAQRKVSTNNDSESNIEKNIDIPNMIGLKPKIPSVGVKRKETWQEKVLKKAAKKKVQSENTIGIQKVATTKKKSTIKANSKVQSRKTMTQSPQGNTDEYVYNYPLLPPHPIQPPNANFSFSEDYFVAMNSHFPSRQDHVMPLQGNIHDPISTPTIAFDESLGSTSSMSYMELLTRTTEASYDINRLI